MNTNISLPTKKAKLVFRHGRNNAIVSTYDGMVVLIDQTLNPKPEINFSYNCTLKPMFKGNGYIVVAAERERGIEAELSFYAGKQGNMVSTYEGKIVIAPDELNVDTKNIYSCEIVPSIKGAAFIVVSAKVARPKQNIIAEDLVFWMGKEGDMVSTHEGVIVIVPENIQVLEETPYICELMKSPKGNALIVLSAKISHPKGTEIVEYPIPSYVVELKINGIVNEQFQFDAIEHNEVNIWDMADNITKLNIENAKGVSRLFEDACNRKLNAYKEKAFGKNTSMYKK